jgi:hypothetical protein
MSLNLGDTDMTGVTRSAHERADDCPCMGEVSVQT